MYNFILNPIAGRGKARKAMDKIEKYLRENNIEYKVHRTEYPQHAIEISKDISSSGDNVIAVGGDGTVSEVLNGMTNFEGCALGIIPCGTGNDFSKFIGLPKNPVAAVKKIIDTIDPKYTDFMQLNGKRVMNVTGMGMDVSVLELCKRMKLFKGKLQYLIALIRILLKFDWYNFTVQIDDKPAEQKTVLLVAACNGKYFGGGMPISPLSDISDNYINLIIVNKLNKWKIPVALINLLRGKLLKYDFVENILCKSVNITTPDGRTVINIDGEIVKDIPFECSLVKDRLKMFR
jgi:diacylglycerol kinase (ATP)